MHKHERPRPEARGVVDDPRQDHPNAATPANSIHSEALDPPDGVMPLAVVLRELVSILPGLKAALDYQGRSRVEPLTYRLDELTKVLGVSRRAIERERASGRFPRPDLSIGKMPLWRVETVRAWLGRGGK